jgi:hypothetical protein
LRALKFPLVPETLVFSGEKSTVQATIIALDQSVELQCHSSQISRIRLSYDESHLFTVSDDGILVVYKVQDRIIERLKKEKDQVGFSDEILVKKSELMETFKVMRTLKKKVEELKKDNDAILRKKDYQYSEKMAEVCEKYNLELGGLRTVHHISLIMQSSYFH